MNINELLEESKIGVEDYKKLNAIELIYNTSEEDRISFLLSHSIENLKENEQIMYILNQANSQIKGYEERKKRGRGVQESFARMKFDALKNTYIELAECINNQETFNNKELLGNSVALIVYIFEEISEKCNKKINLPELVIQEEVEAEYSFIKENL